MTNNYILIFNASNGEPEAKYLYPISPGSYPDFIVSDNNTFYFGAITSLINGSMDIEAYNFDNNGNIGQLCNYSIPNVANGSWGTDYDIVELSNGYLNVTFLNGNLAGMTYLLNITTGTSPVADIVPPS